MQTLIAGLQEPILKQDVPLSLESTASQVTLASEGWRRQWSHSGHLNFLRGPPSVGSWNAMLAPSRVSGLQGSSMGLHSGR